MQLFEKIYDRSGSEKSFNVEMSCPDGTVIDEKNVDFGLAAKSLINKDMLKDHKTKDILYKLNRNK